MALDEVLYSAVENVWVPKGVVFDLLSSSQLLHKDVLNGVGFVTSHCFVS
jgi:hypothetical protein